MPTEYESICCYEVHHITPKLEGPNRCITQHAGFLSNFINEYVVELAVYEYNYVAGPLDDNEPTHEVVSQNRTDAKLKLWSIMNKACTCWHWNNAGLCQKNCS